MRPIRIPRYINEIWNSSDNTQEAQINFIKGKIALQSGLPQVSIVIPAYNEEKHILGTLRSLVSNITHRPYEIVVVNNNSSDRTGALVRAAGVTCIDEYKQGITMARNAGLGVARGKFVLNADADTVYPAYWIEEMVKPLEDDAVALTYGRFSFIPIGHISRTAYFFYEYVADCLRYINKYFRTEAVNVYGFNSGFRREQGLQVNSFDHPPGSNEDGYLALKLQQKGFGKLYYVTNIKALVWTTDRRILIDGGLLSGVTKRIKRVFSPQKG